MAITAAHVVTLTDHLATEYVRLRGVTGQAYGMGTSGDTERAFDKASDFESAVLAMSGDVAQYLVGAAATAKKLCDINDRGFFYAAGRLASLKLACAQAGLANVTSIDLFARYYNTGDGAPWNCLFSPYFRLAYYAVLKAYPTNTNVFFQCKQGEVFEGTTFTNALRKGAVTGAGAETETAGFDIDADSYAGGIGKITMSGITGSGTLTIAGTWRKPDGTTETGDGTANVTGDGTFTLTPPTADSLLLACSALTTPAGISAGTYYVETYAPAGRTHPLV